MLLPILCWLSALGSAAPQSETAAPAVERRPRNLILMIADGFGPASRTMARDYSGELLMLDELLVGSASTRSSNSFVTDSAAGATAYASGVQTYNGAIGVGPTGVPVATLLEAAERRGMATGLVTTARMTHATPACFAAHVPNRAMEARIGEQELAEGIELFLGGGQQFFLPREEAGGRLDDRNLFDEARGLGYQVLEDRADFDGELRLPLIGLFTYSHMSYEIDRDPALEPSLLEMTSKALELLSGASKQGFFLMIEGGRIDHAGHANDPAAHVHDILAFDAALSAAHEFAQDSGETLLVSVADHETGGLALGRNENNTGVYAWRPEYLKTVDASIEVMMNSVDNAASLRAVLKRSAKIESFSKAEDALLAEVDQLEGRGRALRASQVASILISQRALIGWSTWGHTAVDIEVFTSGPRSSVFRGHHTNFEVGRLLAQAMDFDLDATTPVLEASAPAGK